MNCSATSLGLLLTVLAAHGAYAESVTELDDAAARMQYAFYTSDSQGIETVLKTLEEFQVEDALAASKAYQLAYGNWKLSQLYLQPPSAEHPKPNAKSLAAKAAQACVRQARNAVEKDATLAEALAIEAACEGHSATARTGSAGCANSKPLRTAAGLAPNNPRVKLIQAICAPNIPADPAATERWRAVVARAGIAAAETDCLTEIDALSVDRKRGKSREQGLQRKRVGRDQTDRRPEACA